MRLATGFAVLALAAGCGQSERADLERQRLDLERQKLALEAQRLAAASDADRRDCLDNLRQIHGAIQTHVIQEDKSETYAPTVAELLPYFALQRLPVCPAAGKYILGDASAEPSCSVHGTLTQAIRR